MEDLSFLHNTYDGELYPGNKSEQNNQSVDSSLLPLIVLVEDDKALSLVLCKYLQKTFNNEVLYYENAQSCLKDFAERPAQQNRAFCLITDISLEQGQQDGLFLIDGLHGQKCNFISIVMTGFASIESAIASTKKGAFHYLTKPFELDVLGKLVADAQVKKFNLPLDILHKKQNAPAASCSLSLKAPAGSNSKKLKLEHVSSEDIFCGMIGRSPQMKEVFERIKKVAPTDSTILVTGPSGTGKELVAKAIHQNSPRTTNNKVSINCGAIPADLLESELFGHVKGAFTGAVSNRMGRFELANNGTLFLDEIGDMPLLLQVKLLRAIQSKQIEPVGGLHTLKINVRIIAATHRDLDKLVSENKFREDLFYRLNVIPIKIPALKERREDIPLLISHFLSRFVSADGSNAIEFSDEALEMLYWYDWPGNVRELENVIERLVILKAGNAVKVEDLPSKILQANPLVSKNYTNLFELPDEGIDLKQILEDVEDSLIRQALERTSGNKNQASKLLTLNRTTLIEKLKKKNNSFLNSFGSLSE